MLALTTLTAAAPLPRSPPQEAEAIPVVLLYDVGAGQMLYDKQARLRFVPASMTKTMTAYVAFELIRAGKLSPGQTFRVRPETAGRWQGSGATMNLRAGESISVDLLLRGLATISANDAAVVLAEGHAGSVAAWCDLMNAEASRLGMADSHFATPNGWPDEGATYVSAERSGETRPGADLSPPGALSPLFRPEELRLAARQRAQSRSGHRRGCGSRRHQDRAHPRSRLQLPWLGRTPGPPPADGGRRWPVLRGPQRRLARVARMGLCRMAGSPALCRPRPGGRSARAGRRGAAGRPDRAALFHPRGHAGRRCDRAGAQGHLPGTARRPDRQGPAVAELEIAGGPLPPGRVPLYAASDIAVAGPIDRLVNGLAGLLP